MSGASSISYINVNNSGVYTYNNVTFMLKGSYVTPMTDTHMAFLFVEGVIHDVHLLS